MTSEFMLVSKLKKCSTSCLALHFMVLSLKVVLSTPRVCSQPLTNDSDRAFHIDLKLTKVSCLKFLIPTMLPKFIIEKTCKENMLIEVLECKKW